MEKQFSDVSLIEEEFYLLELPEDWNWHLKLYHFRQQIVLKIPQIDAIYKKEMSKHEMSQFIKAIEVYLEPV